MVGGNRTRGWKHFANSLHTAGEKIMAKKKNSRFLQALFYIITTFCLVFLTAMLIAIFSAENSVPLWKYISVAVDIFIIIGLIFYGIFTTNETIAWKRR